MRAYAEFTGAVELMVSIGAGVVVDELAREDPVDQHRKFAGGGGYGFGFADADCQAAVKLDGITLRACHQ